MRFKGGLVSKGGVISKIESVKGSTCVSWNCEEMLVSILSRVVIVSYLYTSLTKNTLPIWKVKYKVGSICVVKEEKHPLDENNSM